MGSSSLEGDLRCARALVALALAGLHCGGELSPGRAGGASPTYWGSVAPLLARRCTRCHRDEGIGPFALTSYVEARARARLLASEAASGRMPPWPPASRDCRALRDTRTLAAEEVQLLAAWADAGAPEGDARGYVPPPEAEADTLPRTPGWVLEPAAPYRPREDIADDHHCFVLDPRLDAPRDVIGVRVVPGDPRIVHHVVLFEVRAEGLEALRRLDDAEPGEGYTCFGGTGIPERFRVPVPGSTQLADLNQQLLVAWGPGGAQASLPPDTALRLEARSRLLMQVHYNVNGRDRGVTDRTRVELFFAPSPVRHQAYWVPLQQRELRIPAGARSGDPAARARASLPAHVPFPVHGLFPHMHLRGSSLRVERVHEQGLGADRETRECLLEIPAWRFAWQLTYWLAAPLRVASGDHLVLTCGYDNTAANQPVVGGVRRAPRELAWGEGTDDEMCSVLFYVEF